LRTWIALRSDGIAAAYPFGAGALNIKIKKNSRIGTRLIRVGALFSMGRIIEDVQIRLRIAEGGVYA